MGANALCFEQHLQGFMAGRCCCFRVNLVFSVAGAV